MVALSKRRTVLPRVRRFAWEAGVRMGMSLPDGYRVILAAASVE